MKCTLVTDTKSSADVCAEYRSCVISSTREERPTRQEDVAASSRPSQRGTSPAAQLMFGWICSFCCKAD